MYDKPALAARSLVQARRPVFWICFWRPLSHANFQQQIQIQMLQIESFGIL